MAFLCYAGFGTASTQEFVAPGRSTTTDDVDLSAGVVKRSNHVLGKVEPGGDQNAATSPVRDATQIAIELLQRSADVTITMPVNHIDRS